MSTKIYFIENKYNEDHFYMETTVEEINKLRMTMISKVETLSIYDIDIYENTSILQDEILLDRLKQIPLKSKNLNLVKSCKDCNEIDYFNINFNCDKEFYSLRTTDISSKYIDPKLNLEIVRLTEGQKISLTVYIKRGKGSDHYSWNPILSLRYTEIEDNTLTCKNKYILSLRNNGSLSSKDIIKRAIYFFDNIEYIEGQLYR